MPQGELTYGCVHVEELAVTSQSRRGPPGAGGWLWLTRPLAPAARCPPPRAQLAHTTARAAQARGLVAGTKLGMLMLRSYLLIAVLLLVVKAVQLRGG
jgi:hypothetical protein